MSTSDLLKRLSQEWGSGVKEPDVLDYIKKYWFGISAVKALVPSAFSAIRSGANGSTLLEIPGKHVLVGGLLLIEKELKIIKELCNYYGDDVFFVCELGREFDDALALVFPTSISWNDLVGGGQLSHELFFRPNGTYLVSSKSGKWGKIANMDFEVPYDFWAGVPLNVDMSELFMDQDVDMIAKLNELIC